MRTHFIGLFFVLSAVVGFRAQAQDVSALVGGQFDNADSDIIGGKLDGKLGYHLGAVVLFPLQNAFEIRSGFIYVARSYSYALNGYSLDDYKFSYIQIPVDFFYKFSEFGGAFIGPSLDFNVSKSCPGVNGCSGVNSIPIGVQFGVNFHFAPQLSAELYYEAIPGNLEDHVKNAKAVNLSLLFNFE